MVRARGTSLQLLRGRARVAATSSPGADPRHTLQITCQRPLV